MTQDALRRHTPPLTCKDNNTKEIVFGLRLDLDFWNLPWRQCKFLKTGLWYDCLWIWIIEMSRWLHTGLIWKSSPHWNRWPALTSVTPARPVTKINHIICRKTVIRAKRGARPWEGGGGDGRVVSAGRSRGLILPVPRYSCAPVTDWQIPERRGPRHMSEQRGAGQLPPAVFTLFIAAHRTCLEGGACFEPWPKGHVVAGVSSEMIWAARIEVQTVEAQRKTNEEQVIYNPKITQYCQKMLTMALQRFWASAILFKYTVQ